MMPEVTTDALCDNRSIYPIRRTGARPPSPTPSATLDGPVRHISLQGTSHTKTRATPTPEEGHRVASNKASKTARASVRAGQSAGGALSVLGEFKYVIPLNSGRHAYVRNLTNGQTVHVPTDS